jgi:hypothetical protein
MGSDVADSSLVQWRKKSRFAHLLKGEDRVEWIYDYGRRYSRGTILLNSGFSDCMMPLEREYKTTVIKTTGTIAENELDEVFEWAECWAVLRGGEVAREVTQTTIDWG